MAGAGRARWRLAALSLALAGWAQPATAQGLPDGPALSFTEAHERLMSRSDSLSAARAGLRASQDQAAAVGTLGRPIVSFDAQALRYQKTIDLSLDPAKALVQSSVDGFLASLPGRLPSVPPAILGQVTGVVDQGMSDALAQLPGSVRLQQEQSLVRSSLTAVAPLYTGGLITATKRAAQAGVSGAEAELAQAGDEATIKLVQTYFGQQLAAQILKVSTESRDGFERHLQDALKLEREGMISKAQRLQVEVARNAALRQYERAVDQHDTARRTLAALLRETSAVRPSTPLFVNPAPIGAADDFVQAAMANQPVLRRLDALQEQAAQGVKAAQAAQKPTVYGFAKYSLDRDQALLIEPDWIFGVGVHYTLLSGLDRGKAVSAARERANQAASAQAEARVALQTLTLRAHGNVETARRQYGLLAVNIEAARENLRLQDLAFREGEAPSSAVIDARVALSLAETQRAAAAYEYDLALAELLAVSGQATKYADYIRGAEQETP